MKNDSKGLLKRSTFSIDGRVLGPAPAHTHQLREHARVRQSFTKRAHSRNTLGSKKTDDSNIWKLDSNDILRITDSRNSIFHNVQGIKILYFENIYNSKFLCETRDFPKQKFQKFPEKRRSPFVWMIKTRLKQTIDRSSSRSIPFHSKDTSQPNPISSTSSSKHIRSNEVHVERKIVITKSGVGGKKRKGVGVGRDRGRVYGRVRYHSRFESTDFHSFFFFWRNKKEKKISKCREKRFAWKKVNEDRVWEKKQKFEEDEEGDPSRKSSKDSLRFPAEGIVRVERLDQRCSLSLSMSGYNSSLSRVSNLSLLAGRACAQTGSSERWALIAR